VASLYRAVASKSLVAKLATVRLKLRSPRLYEDSLSRRQLGKPSEPANRRKWDRFVSPVDRIIQPLQAPSESN